MDSTKTNAMRILDKAGVKYNTYTYDHSDGLIDGISVAGKMGQPVGQVFKTLVTQGHSGNFFVFMIPVAQELDLKTAARSVGEKSIEMIKVADINKITGYVRGGCSPIGMKKDFTTVLDESGILCETIIMSAGRIGQQIELAPEDLVKLIGCKIEPVAVQER